MTKPPRPAGLPVGLRDLDRTAVMGVLNVTPDSFSDGGMHLDTATAIAHGEALVAQGADLVDVGGESTRPGADRISVDEELARVLPVVRGLADLGIAVSIDTMNSATAAATVEAGAAIVNDVSGGVADPEMLATIAELGVPYVCMHSRGIAATMNDLARYDDVVEDVCDELRARLAACDRAGVESGRVVLDPGLGFAKNADHNWELLRRLPELAELGRPILLGASRKRFLGSVLEDAAGEPTSPDERDVATAAISALAVAHDVWCVRVHAPRPTGDAIAVATAWRG